MKRLTLLLLASLLSATSALAAFPTNQVSTTLDINDLDPSSPSDYRHKMFGFNTYEFTYTFTEGDTPSDNSGQSFLYRVSGRLGGSNVIFLALTPSDISLNTSSSITFAVANTNIPPNGEWNSEILSYQGVLTNASRTYGRGKWLVKDSLYDDDGTGYPFPNFNVTNAANYVTQDELVAATNGISAGLGDITAVLSGPGLSGGKTSGSVTLTNTLVGQVDGNTLTNTQQDTAIAVNLTTNGIQDSTIAANLASNALQDAALFISTNSVTQRSIQRFRADGTYVASYGTDAEAALFEDSNALNTDLLIFGPGTYTVATSNEYAFDDFRFIGQGQYQTTLDLVNGITIPSGQSGTGVQWFDNITVSSSADYTLSYEGGASATVFLTDATVGAGTSGSVKLTNLVNGAVYLYGDAAIGGVFAYSSLADPDLYLGGSEVFFGTLSGDAWTTNYLKTIYPASVVFDQGQQIDTATTASTATTSSNETQAATTGWTTRKIIPVTAVGAANLATNALQDAAIAANLTTNAIQDTAIAANLTSNALQDAAITAIAGETNSTLQVVLNRGITATNNLVIGSGTLTGSGNVYVGTAGEMTNGATRSLNVGFNNNVNGTLNTLAAGLGHTATGDNGAVLGQSGTLTNDTSILLSLDGSANATTEGGQFKVVADSIVLSGAAIDADTGVTNLPSGVTTATSNSTAASREWVHRTIVATDPTTGAASGIDPSGTVFTDGIAQSIGSASLSNTLSSLIVADTSSLGSELTTNGTFTGSAGGWALSTASFQSSGTYSNTVRFDAGTTGSITPSNAIAHTLGNVYLMSYKLYVPAGTSAVSVAFGDVTNDVVIAAAAQDVSFIHRTTSTNQPVYSLTVSTNSAAYLDDVSIKLITDGDIHSADDMYLAGKLYVNGIEISPSGEVNDGVSVGAGDVDVYAGKTGTDIEIKSLVEGANITLTQTSSNITIAASGGGGGAGLNVTGENNFGTALSVVSNISDSAYFTRSYHTNISGLTYHRFDAYTNGVFKDFHQMRLP